MNKKNFLIYSIIAITILISIILFIDRKSDTYKIQTSISTKKTKGIKKNQAKVSKYNNILVENDNKKDIIMSDFERKSLIKKIINEVSKGKYQSALDILKLNSKKYEIGQEVIFNYMANDLTMLINLKNNPEKPNNINSSIYQNNNEMNGLSYHVKDKLPITYYNMKNFKSPEICALASLHFSYEMIAFSVDDKNSYVNLIAPDETIEIINYNPALSKNEKDLILNLKKRKNNISEVYVFEMKNIERDFCFKAYVYKEYESDKANLYGYFFDDLRSINNVDFSTAGHFIEIYSAASEKRKINYSKLDSSENYYEERTEETANDRLN